MFYSKMAKSQQNIKRLIQTNFHFRWENYLSVGTPYTCDYLRSRDSMLFDQDIIVLFR